MFLEKNYSIYNCLKVPDGNETVEVDLGFDNAKGYLDNKYFGSSVGRYANRIAKGQFKIGDESFQLNINNGPNHLHGGFKGFGVAEWEAKIDDSNSSVTFTHISPDGDENYPGTLIVNAQYSLSQDGSINIRYTAMSSKATPINIVNHMFINLAGHNAGLEKALHGNFEIKSEQSFNNDLFTVQQFPFSVFNLCSIRNVIVNRMLDTCQSIA